MAMTVCRPIPHQQSALSSVNKQHNDKGQTPPWYSASSPKSSAAFHTIPNRLPRITPSAKMTQSSTLSADCKHARQRVLENSDGRSDRFSRAADRPADHPWHPVLCVVGGQAVNAYVEPVVSLDLDLAIAADHLPLVGTLLGQEFRVEQLPHSLNVADPGSDPRYTPFVDRATTREVLGHHLPVACLEDVLQGKIWAVMDAERRPSKRQKDLADIARLLETYPFLRHQVPAEVLARLV